MKNKKRTISSTYMNNIVSSIGKKNNNYVFVKHYGSYSIDAEDAKNAMTLYGNLEVNYIHLANNDMAESYAPFLSIIRNCYEKYYSDLTIEEYLNQFEIYELHKPFFATYIDSGECERYEPFILDEIKFEKGKVLKSITNIIMTLSKKHPMLIMIDNAHVLPLASIRLLKLLFDDPDNKNIGVFAAYNDLKQVINISKSEWNSFINTIGTKGCIFEGGSYETGEDEDESNEFVFDSKRVYEYLHKIESMYCTVELEQAEYYLQKIYKKLSNEKVNIDVDCKFELLRLYTEVLINLGDFTTALLICDSLKEMCDFYSNLRYEYNYYLLSAYTQMYSRKVEYAKTLVSKCKEIAQKNEK